jgi:hypothetical protein
MNRLVGPPANGPVIKKKTSAMMVKEMANTPRVLRMAYDVMLREERDQARMEFDINGFVKVEFLGSPEDTRMFCRKAVRSIWNETMKSSGFKKEIMDKIPLVTDDEILKKLMSPLSKDFEAELNTVLGKSWFPGSTFGAPPFTETWSFKEFWQVRLNIELNKFAEELLDGKAGFSIDRCSMVAPGKGMMESLHTDYDFPDPSPEGLESIQGKMAITPGVFCCSPGSHKRAGEFKSVYGEFMRFKKGAKTTLDSTKPDPFGIRAGLELQVINPGEVIFWHPALWHQVGPNSGAAEHRINFALYIGFQKNVDRPMYKAMTGKNEAAERYEFWAYGARVSGFPSGDKVQFLPGSSMRFPSSIKKITDRMDGDNEAYNFSNRTMKDGSEVPWLEQVGLRKPHVRVALNRAGMEGLVGAENMWRFFPDEPGYPKGPAKGKRPAQPNTLGGGRGGKAARLADQQESEEDQDIQESEDTQLESDEEYP